MRYLAISFLISLAACQQSVKEPIEYVDPFIGTGGHGHTYPGAAHPFGMMQLSPDSRLEGWDGCGGYHYSDSILYGFSHTHLSGTGVPDYADVLLMPTTGDLHLNNGADGSEGYCSVFSHEKEKAEVGFYQVFLEDYGVDVQLTVSERSGFHQYTFPQREDAQVVLDLRHRDQVLTAQVEIVDSLTIQGHRYSNSWAADQRLHYFMRLSSPIKNITFTDDSLAVGLSFGHLQEPLQIKVGISAVDVLGAQQNVDTEIPNWNFEQTKTNTQNAWRKALDKIVVEGRSEDKKTIFYTAMYHSMLNPNLYIDVDGRYRGMDLKVHQDTNDKHYTIFSLWDTFRATHPLFTLIEQERTNQFIRTLLRMYEQGGFLPIWELAANYTGCMIGYHAIPVIADAYAKNIRDYDVDKALQAMLHSANQWGLGLSEYRKNGFIAASDEPESVSKTLEYAYDDWCIAMMADSLNHASANRFYERGQFYQNLYDPNTGFMRAKMNNNWHGPFRPDEVNYNYTEANSWQYSLFVPQDIEGHIELMRGESVYEKYLDDLFEASSETSGRQQADITGLIGQYAHGNEPSHHMAYLYNYVGKPCKTQARVRQILEEQYTDLPDGLSGNEDCGQMSSWYVLSAMGFYSVTPGLDYYTIGTPLFDQATINLENGNQFVIKANKLSPFNKYIQSVKLNGNPYNKTYLQHMDIINGGELVFEMGYNIGVWGRESKPPSFINQNELVPVPYFVSQSQTFTDSMIVEIASVKSGGIHYTEDGSIPTNSSPIYNKPIRIEKDAVLKAVLIKEGKSSQTVTSEYYQIDGGRSIVLDSEYANQYAAAGDKTLIDYLRGTDSYRTGRWQGYREDLQATIDLGKTQTVKTLSLGCLQDLKSWIFYPPVVEFWISEDGDKFTLAESVINTFPDNKYGSFTQDYKTNIGGQNIRYIRVKAKNYGTCPDWHLGAGGTTWLFVDELVVE